MGLVKSPLNVTFRLFRSSAGIRHGGNAIVHAFRCRISYGMTDPFFSSRFGKASDCPKTERSYRFPGFVWFERREILKIFKKLLSHCQKEFFYFFE